MVLLAQSVESMIVSHVGVGSNPTQHPKHKITVVLLTKLNDVLYMLCLVGRVARRTAATRSTGVQILYKTPTQ